MLSKPLELGLYLSDNRDDVPTLPRLSRAMDEGLIRPLCALRHDPEARELMEAEVTIIVSDLWLWFGANDSVRLAPQLVRQIIASYPNMYLDDLRIFAEKARASNFGKVYGAFTPAVMMEWLRLYWSDRQIAMEEESYARHLSMKESDQRGTTAYEKQINALVAQYAR